MSTEPAVLIVPSARQLLLRGRALYEPRNSKPSYVVAVVRLSVVLGSAFIFLAFLYWIFPKISQRQRPPQPQDNEETEEEKLQRLQAHMEAFANCLKTTTFTVTAQDIVFVLDKDTNIATKATTTSFYKKSSLQDMEDDIDTESASSEENHHENTSETSSRNNDNLEEEEEEEEFFSNAGTMLRLPPQTDQAQNKSGAPSSEIPQQEQQQERHVSAICAICFTEYVPGDVVAWSKDVAHCCHAFHLDCITNCFAYQQQHAPLKKKKKTITLMCPLCRGPFVRMPVINSTKLTN